LIVPIKNHTDLASRREKPVKRVTNYFRWYSRLWMALIAQATRLHVLE